MVCGGESELLFLFSVVNPDLVGDPDLFHGSGSGIISSGSGKKKKR